MLRPLIATLAAAALVGGIVSAQSRDRSTRTAFADCADQATAGDGFHCEIREATIGGANPIDIDASPNGGIHVRGWDRGDVLVRARVAAHADTDAEARQIVAAIRVETTGPSVHVIGPDTDRDRHTSWSVSFDVQAPRNAVLALNTRNGGIGIEDFGGSAKFRTTNGGVSLLNVGGDIRGGTTNGGVTVELTGDHWDGPGLDVETRNGGIRMTIPTTYSAALETGTTRGRVSVDFPVTVQGRIGRELTTTLGSGGAKIRAVTVNGGVSIRHR
jgi:hypothetical protein